MSKFNKIFVFLDTNVLETRLPGGTMFLSDFVPSREFNLFKTFITENNLQEKVYVAVPELVISEIQQHMVECFRSKVSSLNDQIENHKKHFGDLLDIEYTLRVQDINEYDRLTRSFLNNFCSNIQIIPTPIDEATIKRVIDKAIHTSTPFVKPKTPNGQKEYSDAGFKDALIYETFVSNIGNADLNLFVSNDSDFIPLFSTEIENIKLCSNFEEAISVIKQNFDITIEQDIVTKIKNDDYLKQTVATESGLSVNTDERLAFDQLLEIQKNSSPDNDENDPFVFKIKFYMYVGMNKYLFMVEYDPEANEVISASIDDEEVTNE